MRASSASIRPRGPCSTGAIVENAAWTSSTPPRAIPSAASCRRSSSFPITLRIGVALYHCRRTYKEHAMDVNEEKPETPERLDAIAERLAFKSRFVMLFGEITHAVARTTCTRLIALAEDSDGPITVLISSPGGHVESGDAIHDIIRFVRAPVTTVGTGWVASAGTHVFLAAPKDRRVCLPNTRFMIHQPSGGAGGQSTDIAIQAKEILRTRERIARVIAAQTGTSIERIRRDMERDYWMSAGEAIEYGIVSRFVETHADLKH